jgi:hypothetical protein
MPRDQADRPDLRRTEELRVKDDASERSGRKFQPHTSIPLECFPPIPTSVEWYLDKVRSRYRDLRLVQMPFPTRV